MMSKKPTAPVADAATDKADKADGAPNNRVTKSVAIGIGSAAIVAALMYIRRR
jgi:hypothetical protein